MGMGLIVRELWVSIAVFERWCCRCRLAKIVVWQVLRGRFVAVGMVVADWSWDGGLAKGYVSPCQTIRFAVRNVWFGLVKGMV